MQTMNQETFPEIQAATEALETRIALTESEIAELADNIKAKKSQVKSWRKALAAFTPRQVSGKKKVLAAG
jgi:uncharacterized coiled-coil protein SlyX